MVGVRRWVYRDLVSGETYTVPINPNAMTTPYPQRKFIYKSTTAGPAGTTVTNEAHADPQQWQYSGDILDKAHFDALVYWSRKQNRVQITDHYGRAFIITIDQFNPVPKRAVNVPWRHTYTVSASVYAIFDADTPPPTMTHLSPTHGPAGTVVTITGLNFTGTTAVHFGTVAAAFTVLSDSSMTTTVPDGGGDALVVTTPKGDSNVADFLVGFIL